MFARFGLEFDTNVSHDIDGVRYPPTWFEDPARCAALDVVPVLEVAPPQLTSLQRAERDGARINGAGAWVTKWRVVTLSAEEAAEFAAAQAAQEREQFKASRAVRVEAIVVSVAGMPFDGDETSQNRMARAIVAMQAASETSTLWVLHDNTPATVTLGQLQSALIAAGQAQTALWVAP